MDVARIAKTNSFVASAAADRTLCADGIRNEFKDGFGIIIQPADNTRIDGIGNMHRVKEALDLIKMRPTIIAEIIQDYRRIFRQLLILRALAVKQAHRITLQTLPAGMAKLLLIL